MKYSGNITLPIIIWVFILSCSVNRLSSPVEKAKQSFVQIPDSVQTSVYWYWISDHLSKEGVVEDLKSMKKVGINRAFIGNIFVPGLSAGSVKIFSDEWWDILHTALKTAGELNIEIGLFNSPGWSQSGGPWIKPEQAMRYLAAIDTVIQGPIESNLILRKSEHNFEDVKVVAFKLPENADKTLRELIPVITSSAPSDKLSGIMDGNTSTSINLPAQSEISFTFSVKEPFTARSITIYPAIGQSSKMTVTLEAGDGKKLVHVKTFEVDRLNNNLNVGFEQFAPVIESFPDITANTFRVSFTNASAGSGVADISLDAAPKIARYKEKTLARMHPTPLAYWKDYLWPKQPEPVDSGLVIREAEVIDLTSRFDSASGVLSWKVPPGKWKILRTGMTPTLVTNTPAPPEGTGLEVDKMSQQHVLSHFDAFLGEVIRRIPAGDRKTWKVVVQDSYETGGQNWTDDFENKFKKAFGYSPIPYIPALYGYVIGSQDQSDRFLWDLRRFVADCIAYEYVGGLREISHRYGLRTWLENYGHWGFPGEFLQYGGQSDEIGGEFWSEGELGDIENRAASSAAHIYGKTKVSAESFTAAGAPFARYPAMLKQRGDRFFTEGINNTLLHVYVHQPYENRKPGVNAWFGTEFNRFNTWYNDMDIFIDYLKRCNFMLQQGKYVADVAYFIGEDAPKMTGAQTPPLPKGYSFDYINGEVIQKRMDVKDGKFILPDGMQYKVLVLPPLETMRPELLKKIAVLVKKGGIIVGPRPKYSPSLTGYGEADKEVARLAKELWGNIDGQKIKVHPIGKGMVMEGMTLEEVFTQIKLDPDFKTAGTDPVLYIHRTISDGEIYFISNQRDTVININPVFRAEAPLIELWNTVTGTARPLMEFSVAAGKTTIPLKLEPYESAFIVFRKGTSKQVNNKKYQVNYPQLTKQIPVSGGWEVNFDTTYSSAAGIVHFDSLINWSRHPDPRIAHFSGTATYRKTIAINDFSDQASYMLDLGKVIAIAKVYVNGRPVGGVWTPPYQVDISPALKNGDNLIEIKVVNTWVNQLIGDQKSEKEKQRTWLLYNPYKSDSPLEPAGLLGPVSVKVYD